MCPVFIYMYCTIKPAKMQELITFLGIYLNPQSVKSIYHPVFYPLLIPKLIPQKSARVS